MKNTALGILTAAIFLNGCATTTLPPPIQSPYQGLYDMRVQEAEIMAKEVDQALKTLTPAEVLRKVQSLVSYEMKDPDSAKFRNLRFVKYNEKTVVCGEVNAKNSYGGYVGFENFIAGQTQWRLSRESEEKTAAGSADSAGFRTYCRLGEVVKLP